MHTYTAESCFNKPPVQIPSISTLVVCQVESHLQWVRGLMAINVGCEFCGRGSIPSVCQITDADLGQVG